MLWSLIRILAFVAIVTALTYGAVMLSDMPGQALLTFGGVEVPLSLLELAFVLLALALLVWIGLKLLGLLMAVLHFLNGDETAISRYFTRNRERRGYQALSEGMMALASGEGHLALAKAAKAERFLDRPELTTILTAQAAEMAGDRKKAEETYKRLLQDDKTRFVGVRGILKQRLADGDTDTALKLAEKAFALKPRHAETQDILLQLQAGQGDWKGARATLTAKQRSGHLPKDVHKRRDAILALSEAQEVFAEGATIEAREAAIAANKQSPDLVPAAVLAAQAYIENGKPKNAARLLAKAWAAQPHPDLAAAFARIAPEETPQERLKRFTALTKQQPDHPEARMLLAELNLAAEDFPAARRALGDLAESDPTTRSLTLMAAIERGTGADDAAVRGFLAKAVTAPHGPQWICESCQHIHADWAPTCENCGGLDTLAWKQAPRSPLATPTGAEMLPLIIGSTQEPDDPTATDAPIDSEVIEAEPEK